MEKGKEIASKMRAFLSENGISMSDAADRLGVSQQAVSNQLSGRKLGPTVARSWADVFGFRMEYLLTGEGPVMEGEEAPPADTVPIVPYAVRGGALQGFSEGVEEWECERITSPIRGAELAFEVTGDSMAPGFPAGARVLLKRVKSVIAWGEVHVIDTVDGPVLKRIDQGENGTFILRSDNPAYQPIVVTRDEIRGVWRVLLRMIQ
jgi:Predicted transcriptional regulator